MNSNFFILFCRSNTTVFLQIGLELIIKFLLFTCLSVIIYMYYEILKKKTIIRNKISPLGIALKISNSCLNKKMRGPFLKLEEWFKSYKHLILSLKIRKSYLDNLRLQLQNLWRKKVNPGVTSKCITKFVILNQ